MYNEERRLSNRIRSVEDMLLRSKSGVEIEKLSCELGHMRVQLQKLQWERIRRESLR